MPCNPTSRTDTKPRCARTCSCPLRLQVGAFNQDNRAGLDGTLHRISCIRNRAGRIVGLTCRVGRSIMVGGGVVVHWRPSRISCSCLLPKGGWKNGS